MPSSSSPLSSSSVHFAGPSLSDESPSRSTAAKRSSAAAGGGRYGGGVELGRSCWLPSARRSVLGKLRKVVNHDVLFIRGRITIYPCSAEKITVGGTSTITKLVGEKERRVPLPRKGPNEADKVVMGLTVATRWRPTAHVSHRSKKN
jgi:hypothetical protein